MRIVIAGAGQTGLAVATHFAARRDDVILIDRDPATLAKANDALDVMTLEAEVTHRATLHQVEVERADAFVALTASDAENLVGACLAKQLGAGICVARVDDPAFYETSRGVERGVLGLDTVLCATRLAASQLLGQLTGLDTTYIGSFAAFGLRGALVPVRPATALDGRSPRRIELPQGVRLCGVVRDGFLRAPADLSRLEAGDGLLLVGDGDAFLDAWAALVPEVVGRRALVVGGSDVGALLAQTLGRRLSRVELLELSLDRAQELSQRLSGVTVMAGDARQLDLLHDLQIDTVEYLLAATHDDEVNLLVSLLARQLGVSRVLALLHESGHAGLFGELGVDGVASAFSVLAQLVTDFAIASGPVRVAPIPGTAYVLLEWRLPTTASRSAGATLSDLPLTANAAVVGLARGADTLEPAGGTRLGGGETLVLAVDRSHLEDLEARLARFGREVLS